MGRIAYFGDEITSKFLSTYGIDCFYENIFENFLKVYKGEDYFLIIISEEHSHEISKVYEEINKKILPAILFLPSKGVKKELNYKYIKKLTEKAIGVDILEKGE